MHSMPRKLQFCGHAADRANGRRSQYLIAISAPRIRGKLWRRRTAPAALASIALDSVLVVVMLALRGLNFDLPIYAGLGGSLVAYVPVSLGVGRCDIEPVTGLTQRK